ncbi:MAG: hypothetical protein R3360_06350, partial [Alphaproteobacteria bacterium]|nr:hypothetical protein [Alphaproteobacteria bacterium]
MTTIRVETTLLGRNSAKRIDHGRRPGAGGYVLRGLLAAGLLSLVAAVPARADSIRILEAGDLPTMASEEDVRARLEGADGLLVDREKGLRVDINTPASAEGVRLGIAISLDSDDQITLREGSHLFLQSDFLRRPDLVGSLASESLSGLNRPMLNLAPSQRGLDMSSILRRASWLTGDLPQIAVQNQAPGIQQSSYAQLRLGFGTADPLADNPKERGFSVAVSSMVMVPEQAQTGLDFFDTLASGRAAQVYNLGLDIGYKGFSFAASFLSGESAYSRGFESIDVGLSYEFG